MIPAHYVRSGEPRVKWFMSPDRTFVFRLTEGEALSVRLDLMVRARSSQRARVAVTVKDANGAAWLPRHPHTLIVAGSGVYGPPMLAYWSGGRLLRRLVPAPKAGLAELFGLRGVSRDGSIVYYIHSSRHADTKEAFRLEDEQLRKVRVLRLSPGR